MIASVCYRGSRDLLREIRANASGHRFRAAIAGHDTPTLFDWLIEALSYQGIADRVAYDYMERYGGITWRDIEQSLSRRVSCEASELLALLRLPLPKELRDLCRTESH